MKREDTLRTMKTTCFEVMDHDQLPESIDTNNDHELTTEQHLILHRQHWRLVVF